MERLLILAELDQGQVKGVTLAAVSFAQGLASTGAASFDILVAGRDIAAAAESLATWGAGTIHTLDHPDLEHPLADRYSHVLAGAVRQLGATLVVASASTFSKDILPRAAALLDAGMVSDVIEARAEGG